MEEDHSRSKDKQDKPVRAPVDEEDPSTQENSPEGSPSSDEVILDAPKKAKPRTRTRKKIVLTEEEVEEIVDDHICESLVCRCKRFFRGWDLFDICFIVMGMILPVVLGVVFGAHWLEIISAVLIIVSNFLLAKAKVEGYVLYVASMILYAYIATQFALYGEMVYSILVSTPLAVYGLVKAIRNKRKDKEMGQVIVINKIKRNEILIALSATVVIGIVFFFILQAFNTVFIVVSVLSLSVSIIGEYFIARRSRIGMFGFFLSDVFTITLWIMLLVINGEMNAVPLVATYGMLLINDVYGLVEWRKVGEAQIAASGRRLMRLMKMEDQCYISARERRRQKKAQSIETMNMQEQATDITL